jgi:hypothetical protein
VRDADWFQSRACELDAVMRALRVALTGYYCWVSQKHRHHDYQFLLDSVPARTVHEDVLTFVDADADY